VVTNPYLPDVTDALKTVNIAEEAGTEILGVVVNRAKFHEAELDPDEIESMVGHPVIMEVPEDEAVQEALAKKMPVVHHDPDHHVSERFRKVAAEVAGIEYEPDLQQQGFLSRLVDRFR
jgi:MinD-like ATPase involved in chromosome partitioning or flagellar assembly